MNKANVHRLTYLTAKEGGLLADFHPLERRGWACCEKFARGADLWSKAIVCDRPRFFVQHTHTAEQSAASYEAWDMEISENVALLGRTREYTSMRRSCQSM